MVFRPEREAQVIDGLKAVNPGPLRPRAWRRSGARSCRPAARSRRPRAWPTWARPAPSARKRRWASSAPPSSRCPAPPSTVLHNTVAGSADFGIVPVENSTEGVVTRSLDLFLTTPCSSSARPACWCATTCCAARTRWRASAVCAHPQALAQCHGWLSLHLPQAERRPVASNAEGARPGGGDATIAAIASVRAGGEFGLHVVHRRSRTKPTTARASPSSPTRSPPRPAASGNDCTSLIVSVPNRPGAVHDILVPLKNHGVSMTRLSRARRARASGSTTLHRPAGPSRTSRTWPPRCRSCAACAPSSLLGPTPSTCTEPGGQDVQPARRHRLRFDGRLLRLALSAPASSSASSATASRPPPPSARQLGVIDRPPNRRCWPSGLRHGADRRAGVGHRATFKGDPPPGRARRAVHGRGLDQARRGRRRAPRALRARRRFVPAHPIAGKEVAGIAHADAALYSGRQVIPHAAAADHARAGAEGDRLLGRHRRRRCCA